MLVGPSQSGHTDKLKGSGSANSERPGTRERLYKIMSQQLASSRP